MLVSQATPSGNSDADSQVLPSSVPWGQWPLGRGKTRKSRNCSSSATLIAGNMPESLANFNSRPLLMWLILTGLSQGMHRKTAVPDWGNLQQGRNEEWQQPLPVTQGNPQFNPFSSEVAQFRIISTIDLSWVNLILVKWVKCWLLWAGMNLCYVAIKTF